MGNIVKFILFYRPERRQAINWLAQNIVCYPAMDLDYIGDDLFHGWRFVRSSDGVVYFSNFIDPGINEKEFNEFKGYVNIEINGIL